MFIQMYLDGAIGGIYDFLFIHDSNGQSSRRHERHLQSRYMSIYILVHRLQILNKRHHYRHMNAEEMQTNNARYHLHNEVQANVIDESL